MIGVPVKRCGSPAKILGGDVDAVWLTRVPRVVRFQHVFGGEISEDAFSLYAPARGTSQPQGSCDVGLCWARLKFGPMCGPLDWFLLVCLYGWSPLNWAYVMYGLLAFFQ